MRTRDFILTFLGIAFCTLTPFSLAAARHTPATTRLKNVAQPLPPANPLRVAHQRTAGEGACIRIETGGFTSYQDFLLDNPARIVIDLSGVRGRVASKPLTVDAADVRQVRVGRPSSDLVRVVLDLATPVPYRIERKGSTLLVTVDRQLAALTANAQTFTDSHKPMAALADTALPMISPALNPVTQLPVMPLPVPQLNAGQGQQSSNATWGTTPVAPSASQPTAQPQPGAPAANALTQWAAGTNEDIIVKFYRCRYIRSAGALTLLNSLFSPNQLVALVGPEPYSPRLEQGSTSAGSQVVTVKSMADTEGGLVSHDIILRGPRSVVESAISILEKSDHHRRQVRLSVKIVDIDVQKALDLGVKWNWTPNYTVSEKGEGGNSNQGGFFPKQFNIGTLVHTPAFINAALSARGENDTVRLLAMPNMSLLDGERGFILIGERLLFPKIVSYTAVGLPIYDKEEVRTGIYIQFAVQMSDKGDMTLSVYPQVSVIAGFLEINGSKYPEINTREEQTTVRIQNKETLVIGGLLREDEIIKLTTVPGLSNIPVLGELFKNRARSKVKSDLVIMITPEIIADDEGAVEPVKEN